LAAAYELPFALVENFNNISTHLTLIYLKPARHDSFLLSMLLIMIISIASY
jgi:hypothetical protein